MSGKLQVFYDNEYLFSATLRKNPSYHYFPFTLRVRDKWDRVICISGFNTALSAKEYLENEFPGARWFTQRGYVKDDD